MHTKLLIRPETFISRYQHWKDLSRHLQLAAFRESFALELFGTGALDMRFEQSTNQAKLLWQPQQMSHDDLSYWLDDFKEKLLDNGYFNHFSDERIELFDNGVKFTVHRHYLKPKITFREIITPDISHLYGNIFLEHHFNELSNSLSITINYFSHKSYLSFEKLMELLLS